MKKDLEALIPFLRVYIPLRFTRTTLLAYVIVLFAFILAAALVASQAVPLVWTGRRPPLLAPAITTSALVVTVGLWFLSVHPSSELVQKKLAIGTPPSLATDADGVRRQGVGPFISVRVLRVGAT
jgi:hypothetical protein